MTAEEFRQAGLALFGPERGWQSRLAEALGVDRASVTRYLSGAVPGPVSAAVLCWLDTFRRTGQKPKIRESGLRAT
jgi:transcriptional regulator with XRE-family HTH domain